MEKCEMCGKHTHRLYDIPLADDYDEEGRVSVVANYRICSTCIPKEIAEDMSTELERDWKADNQQVIQNLLTARW